MIIDVHHHYMPRRYFEEMERLLPPDIALVRDGARVTGRERATGYVFTPAVDPHFWHDTDDRLRAMDAAGIDHAVLSSACYQDWMTIEAARIVNDGTAELVARHPDRFSGMISIPPDGGEEMVTEIERGRDLGLCAINITTTHRGRYPDHPDFRPLLETAARLRLPVFVHPSWRGPLPHMERWNLERSLGKPTDLNLAIANLMYGGAFQDLPELRMLFAHLGGSLPVTLRRLFYGQKGWLSAPDYDYPALLKRLFVDTAPGMWQSPIEVECAAKVIGAAQMLMGSDYPLSNDPAGVLKLAVGHVANAALPETEKAAIFSHNAIALFALDRFGPETEVVAHGHESGCCGA